MMIYCGGGRRFLTGFFWNVNALKEIVLYIWSEMILMTCQGYQDKVILVAWLSFTPLHYLPKHDASYLTGYGWSSGAAAPMSNRQSVSGMRRVKLSNSIGTHP